MLPIDPSELSAFLDGELPAGRADQVRDALVRDTSLRESFERLAALDADCKARAAAVMFRPRVQLAPRPIYGHYVMAAGAIGLLLVRLALKAPPPVVGAGLGALLLIFFLSWGLRRILRATDADVPPPVSVATA
jgi:anti-sigma factor RsiW